MNKNQKKGKGTTSSEKKFQTNVRIGEGAFGVVYREKDKNGDIVAIKTFKDTQDDGISFGICREIAVFNLYIHIVSSILK